MFLARAVAVTALAVATWTVTGSAAVQGCDRACQETLVEAYFERLSVVYRSGSTTADIDRLFALFGPDVHYVHTRFEADFDRGAWKAAFVANVARGAYSADDDELIDVVRIIHGRGHAAVGYRYVRRAADGSLLPADDQGVLLALFAFDNGRIVRVDEYW